jgi:hypothetical protein
VREVSGTGDEQLRGGGKDHRRPSTMALTHSAEVRYSSAAWA